DRRCSFANECRCVGFRSDGRDLTSLQQREGHDRDFPKLDVQQRSQARGGVAPRASGAKTDGQSVERAFIEERENFAAAFDAGDDAAFHIKPALVLAQFFPDADGFVREMLVEHPHAGEPFAPERLREGAGGDDIAPAVGHAEERGVTFELVAVERGDQRRRADMREASPRVLHFDGHVDLYLLVVRSSLASMRSSDCLIVVTCSSSTATRSMAAWLLAAVFSSTEIRSAADPAQNNAPAVWNTKAAMSALGNLRSMMVPNSAMVIFSTPLSSPAERQRGEGGPGVGHRLVSIAGSPSLASLRYARRG